LHLFVPAATDLVPPMPLLLTVVVVVVAVAVAVVGSGATQFSKCGFTARVAPSS
jgi:hypothetical protein